MTGDRNASRQTREDHMKGSDRIQLMMKIVGAAMLTLSLLVTASPALAQSVSPAYRIGPDDVLVISVWDQKDLEQTVFVRPDGKISASLVGEVQAGGLTVAELESRLTQAYGQT